MEWGAVYLRSLRGKGKKIDHKLRPKSQVIRRIFITGARRIKCWRKKKDLKPSIASNFNLTVCRYFLKLSALALYFIHSWLRICCVFSGLELQGMKWKPYVHLIQYMCFRRGNKKEERDQENLSDGQWQVLSLLKSLHSPTPSHKSLWLYVWHLSLALGAANISSCRELAGIWVPGFLARALTQLSFRAQGLLSRAPSL
jgi:hypothetical protein